MNTLISSTIVYYKDGIKIVKSVDGTYWGGYGYDQLYKIKGLESELTEEEISNKYDWFVNFKPGSKIYTNAEWVYDASEGIGGTSYLVITDDDGNKIHCTYDEDNEVYLAQDGHVYYDACIVRSNPNLFVDCGIGYISEKDFLDWDLYLTPPDTFEELVENLINTFPNTDTKIIKWVARDVYDWSKNHYRG